MENENEKWKIENGKWKMENGRQRSAMGDVLCVMRSYHHVESGTSAE